MKYKETILICIYIVLLSGSLVLLINPFQMDMAVNMQMMLLALIVFSLAAFVGFVWKENPRDEREQANVTYASRYAYMITLGALVCVMVIQSLSHSLDVWIPILITLAVVTKSLIHILQEIRR